MAAPPSQGRCPLHGRQQRPARWRPRTGRKLMMVKAQRDVDNATVHNAPNLRRSRGERWRPRSRRPPRLRNETASPSCRRGRRRVIDTRLRAACRCRSVEATLTLEGSMQRAATVGRSRCETPQVSRLTRSTSVSQPRHVVVPRGVGQQRSALLPWARSSSAPRTCGISPRAVAAPLPQADDMDARSASLALLPS